jgi:molybdopterin/thiamine biosynthesis adenylyltransferase
MEDIIIIEDEEKDRYSRLKLISWWEQEKLGSAKVMVVGAGALGNEILKNLSLLGVGNIFLVDFDTISNSNLSRAVLFRERDEGKEKVRVAARRLKDLNPDIKIQSFNGDVIYDLGLGVFRRMDVVICGLDNREARLAVNRNCWKVNVPFIDGAIEGLNGIARVFMPPHSACYECTMNESDYELLAQRKSCSLLKREDMLQGKVPTTPTVSSIIAGIQVQEAVKLIHRSQNLPVLVGKGFLFNGLNHDSYVVEYTREEDCPSHETYENIISLNESVETMTLARLLKIARQTIGPDAVIDFKKDIIYQFYCKKCKKQTYIFKILGRVTEEEAKCPGCGQIRDFEVTGDISGKESFLDKTLTEIGIPLFDIVNARVGLEKNVQFEFTKDMKKVMGKIA